MEVFPLRLQQLASISTGLIDTSVLLPAFKIFFNVFQASVACQERYLRALRREMEARLVGVLGEECDKIAELKAALDKSEEKYEAFFCRFASGNRIKEPSLSGQEDLVQLHQLRSQYYLQCYAVYWGVCRFQRSACHVFFGQLCFAAKSFSQCSVELGGIGEQVLELRHELSARTQRVKAGKERAFAEMDRQKGFFQKALRSSLSSLNKICAFNNLEAFRVEKSQVLFVKQQGKSWKRSFVRLQNGYLTVVSLGNRSSSQAAAAAVSAIPATQTSSLIGAGGSSGVLGSVSFSSSSKSCMIPILLAEVKSGANAAVCERRHCFELITPQQTMLFQAETEEIMLDWINCIDEAKQDAIKFHEKPAIQESGCDKSEEVKSEALDLFPAGESVYAFFYVSLQKQVLLPGTAFLSENRLVFVVGIAAGCKDECASNRGTISIAYESISCLEMQHYDLYDLVEIEEAKNKYNFKFHNFQGTTFFQVAKYLKECATTKRNSIPLELQIKVAEIMKSNSFVQQQTQQAAQNHRSIVSESPSSLNVSQSGAVSCGCSSHWDWTVVDTVVRFDLDKMYKILYENDKFTHQLFELRNCRECFIGEWTVNPETMRRQRQVSYIIPLKSAFAKEVKCVEYVEVIEEGGGGSSGENCKRMVVETKVKSFDVPYAEYFETFVRYCLTAESSNSTRLLVTSTIHWTKWTALKSVITKQTRATMKETLGIIMYNLMVELKRRYPEYDSDVEDDEEGTGEGNSFSKKNERRFYLVNSSSEGANSRQICFFSASRALWEKKGTFLVIPILLLALCLVVKILKGNAAFQGNYNSVIHQPSALALLKRACSNSFLFERQFEPIELLLASETNDSVANAMRNLKELRKKNAKSLFDLFEMERRLSDALYERSTRKNAAP